MKEGRIQIVKGWSLLYGRCLSQEECKEISDNLNGFFSLLKEWDDKVKKNEEERNCNLRGSDIPSQT